MAFSRKDIRQVEGGIELKNAIKIIAYVLTLYDSLWAGKSDLSNRTIILSGICHTGLL